MSAGPIVIILGPYPHRVSGGLEAVTADAPQTIERYVTVGIMGLDADATADDVVRTLNEASVQTTGRAYSVPFLSLPAAP